MSKSLLERWPDLVCKGLRRAEKIPGNPESRRPQVCAQARSARDGAGPAGLRARQDCANETSLPPAQNYFSPRHTLSYTPFILAAITSKTGAKDRPA
jgi:hypothetical protein